MTRFRFRFLTIVTLLAVTVAACGGGDDDGGDGAGGGGTGGGNGNGNGDGDEQAVDLPECPLDALADAAKPVEITMWHAMTRANEEELQRLAEEFNAAQGDVKVTLSAAPDYPANLTRYRAGLGSGELPDLMQAEDTATQTMIDSGSVLPAAACIAADDYDTSDHIGRVLEYYTVQDVLWPMPFNVSNPILYYNKAAFEAAGLDPEAPPRSLDDLRAAAQAIVDSGVTPYGIAFKSDAWFFEHWMAKSGELFVNNGNGREERATAVEFGGETGVELFEWVKQMADDKLLLSTGDAAIDHYLAIGNEQAAMTIDTSAALGTIFEILGGGEFPNVELGAGPMPGPDSPDGGVLVGGAALYIVNKSTPEKQAAAYEFAKFLNEPESQAEWAAATGYIPVRQASTSLAPLTERWAELPELQIAYDQLLEGAENAATAGPVIGPYGAAGQGVRGAVIDALQAMFTQGTSGADAIAQAVEQSDAAIAEYNERVG